MWIGDGQRFALDGGRGTAQDGADNVAWFHRAVAGHLLQTVTWGEGMGVESEENYCQSFVSVSTLGG